MPIPDNDGDDGSGNNDDLQYCGLDIWGFVRAKQAFHRWAPH